MTVAKIAITLPEGRLAEIRRAVRAGKAESVSGYIARALEEQEQRESLRGLLSELIAEHGEPSSEEVEWAKRALPGRKSRRQ
jgi:Arc/MetJ-type ribon-helix-helix transcriptional regulator